MSTSGSDYNGNSNKKRQNGVVTTNTSVDKQGVLRDNNGKHIKPNTGSAGVGVGVTVN